MACSLGLVGLGIRLGLVLGIGLVLGLAMVLIKGYSTFYFLSHWQLPTEAQARILPIAAKWLGSEGMFPCPAGVGFGEGAVPHPQKIFGVFNMK